MRQMPSLCVCVCVCVCAGSPAHYSSATQVWATITLNRGPTIRCYVFQGQKVEQKLRSKGHKLVKTTSDP